MRLITHLSDLHFGRVEHGVVEALIRDLERLGPDLVVVSGDLTQRGRQREFEDACAFLRRLPAPVLTVPGNHDIPPLYRPLRRLCRTFGAYTLHITPNLMPVYEDDQIMVVGLNSVRANRWKQGAVPGPHLSQLIALLCRVDKFKIVTMHHPLTVPEGVHGQPLARADTLLEAFRSAGVDLLLTGHLHHGHLVDLPVSYVDPAHTILLSQASTATSIRLRKDLNGYHSLRISPTEVRCDRRHFQGGTFRSLHEVTCRKSRKHWRIAESRDARREPAELPAAS